VRQAACGEIVRTAGIDCLSIASERTGLGAIYRTLFPVAVGGKTKNTVVVNAAV
jgi:hypothetical protein